MPKSPAKSHPASKPQPLRQRIIETRMVSGAELKRNPANFRTHPEDQRRDVTRLLEEVGQVSSLMARIDTDGSVLLLDGHLRADIADDRLVRVDITDLTEAEGRLVLALYDHTTSMAGVNLARAQSLLSQLTAERSGWAAQLDAASLALQVLARARAKMTAKTDAAAILANASLTLAERFIVPPVTTLDARQGYWRDRKRAWLSLGIRSEQGRGLNLLRLQHLPNTMANPSFYEYKRDLEQEFGRKLTTGEASAILAERGTIQSVDDKRGKLGRAINDHEWMLANAPGAVPNAAAGTSVFDPVLAELAYRWWCPQGGQVLDPFCGGSVRGIVASMLGRRYAGCDLRQEQIDANERQWDEMDGRAVVKAEHVRPDWRTTDALHVASEFASLAGAVDFVFTCPPYGDLEQYSDDPRDLSAMSYPAFLATYRKIIAAACGMLRQDRFAAIVVADIRDRSGNYRNFVSDTIQAFLDAGLTLYNDAVLITPFATIPLRAGKQFATGRKLTKTHQNVLVFVKGDGKAAADAVGPVECGDVPEAADLEAAESASGRVAAAAPAADEARSTPFGERMTAADLAGEI